MRKSFAQKRMRQTVAPAIAANSHDVNEGIFRRIEDKYLISQEHAKSFIAELKNTMPLSFPDPQTNFTYIKSCYLDSSSLDFFQDHFRGLEERYKVRLRQYAPNGHWDDVALLEIKQKKALESKKIRFFVSPEESLRPIGHVAQFDSLELMQLNPYLKDLALKKRVDKANDLIREYGLVPLLNITYHRIAFERDDVRITFDTNISYALENPPSPLLVQRIRSEAELWNKAQLLSSKFDVLNNVILEIKHQGTLPLWASELLQKWQFQQTNFSKYCWAMTCVLQNYPLLKVA